MPCPSDASNKIMRCPRNLQEICQKMRKFKRFKDHLRSANGLQRLSGVNNAKSIPWHGANYTEMIPCPGVGILKMIPYSVARPRIPVCDITHRKTAESPFCLLEALSYIPFKGSAKTSMLCAKSVTCSPQLLE